MVVVKWFTHDIKVSQKNFRMSEIAIVVSRSKVSYDFFGGDRKVLGIIYTDPLSACEI